MVSQSTPWPVFQLPRGRRLLKRICLEDTFKPFQRGKGPSFLLHGVEQVLLVSSCEGADLSSGLSCSLILGGLASPAPSPSLCESPLLGSTILLFPRLHPFEVPGRWKHFYHEDLRRVSYSSTGRKWGPGGIVTLREGEEPASAGFWEVAYQMPCLLTLNIFGPLPLVPLQISPFPQILTPLHRRSEPQ